MHLTHMDLMIIEEKKLHPIQQHLKTFLMEKVARVIYIIIPLFFLCTNVFAQRIFEETKYIINESTLDTFYVRKDTSITKRYIITNNLFSFEMYPSNTSSEKILLVKKFKIESQPSLIDIFKKSISRQKFNEIVKSENKPSIQLVLNNNNTLDVVNMTFYLDIENPILTPKDLFKIKKCINKYYKPRIISEDKSYKVFNVLIDSAFF